VAGDVVLVHWHEHECAERAEKLRALGYDVFAHWQHESGSVLTRHLKKSRPAAVVLDLGRLPSHGRSVATWLRSSKSLCHIPIVFVPGDKDKTQRIRETFADAAFATWGRMRTALPRAIAKPVKAPIVPSTPDYSGTPLAKKLGLKEGSVLAVVRPPHDWQQTLGDLPVGATSKQGLRGERNVVVLFCRALSELRADWPAAAKCLADAGGLWIAWPKKSSGQVTDLSDGVVRAFGLDQGLVDTKVCAINAIWSGLRFSRRKAAKR
tara:strand:- start:17596 stop:18390 length:795 start_codon:yes stop_codon:yes gene_type:complete